MPLDSHRAKVSELTRYHPYNVLWAQLGDLYGSVGTPLRLAKTIVCGAQSITINKVLSILTYFVRCGEIQRIRSKKILDKNYIESVTSHTVARGKVVGGDIPQRFLDDGKQPTQRLVRTKTYQEGISNIPRGGDLLTACTPVVTMDDNHCANGTNNSKRTKSDMNEAIDVAAQKCPLAINFMSESHSNGANLIADEASVPEQLARIEKIVRIEVHIERLKSPTNIVNGIDNVANMGGNRSESNIKYINSNKYADKNANNSSYSDNEVNNSDSSGNYSDNSGNNGGTITDAKTDNQSSTIVEPTSFQYLANSIVATTTKRSPTTHITSVQSSAPVEVSTGVIFDESKLAPSYLKLTRKLQCASQMERSVTNTSNNNNNNNHATTGDNNNVNDTNNNAKPSTSVVFVLGDNDILSGLKASTHASTVDMRSNKNILGNMAAKSTIKRSVNTMPDRPAIDAQASTSVVTLKAPDNAKPSCKKHCSHKKHSGVKFNFEQYPQIVTNYMKNKNLDITSYDFLEKGLKLEQENQFNYGNSSATMLPPIGMPDDSRADSDEHVEGDECECCANTFRILQTPSNATELEFSNDDGNYPVPTTKMLNTPESSDSDIGISSTISTMHLELKSGQPSQDAKNHDGDQPKINTPSQSNKGGGDRFDLITIPIPKTIFIDEAKQRIRPGYVPSLFVGVTDHFIPDMVLQVSFGLSVNSTNET